MFFDVIVFNGDSVDRFIKCKLFKLFLYFSFQKICCRWHMQKCFVNRKMIHKWRQYYNHRYLLWFYMFRFLYLNCISFSFISWPSKTESKLVCSLESLIFITPLASISLFYIFFPFLFFFLNEILFSVYVELVFLIRLRNPWAGMNHNIYSKGALIVI